MSSAGAAFARAASHPIVSGVRDFGIAADSFQSCRAIKPEIQGPAIAVRLVINRSAGNGALNAMSERSRYHPTLALGPVIDVPGVMLLCGADAPGTVLPAASSVTAPESDEAQAATKSAKAASNVRRTRRCFIRR
jgi:hypothetical protein